MTNPNNQIPITNNQLPMTIVITGFMGTGKTSAGKIVAEKLGREFVDMDAVIEARAGMTVREIFLTQGENYFRARENELCAKLATRANVVIATGGGALVNPQNRAAFANALVVCLDANVDTILARLNGSDERPLLAGDDLRARVNALMDDRRDAYAQIENHIDTTGKSADAIADEIIARMKS